MKFIAKHFEIFSVDLCLKALKHQLPRDLALQMIGRWYTVRNSPGGIGSQSEWGIFITCLLGLMGYDTAKLKLTRQVSHDWLLIFCSHSPARAAANWSGVFSLHVC